MLQVSYIKDNFSRVVSNLNKRNIDFSKQLQEITDLDDLRKKIQSEYDSILNESNNIAKEIGILFKSGKGSEAEELKSKSISLKPKAKELHEKLNNVSE
jgi:seryl-tRNA synthetase